MPEPPSTLRRRQLGRQLRRLREAAGLTLIQAASEIDRTDGTLSRIENGRLPIRPIDVRNLMDVYGVTDTALRDAMDRLARDARKRGWWHSYTEVLSPFYADFIDLESDAARMRSFQCTMIEGLLQTPEYARADITGPLMDPTPSRIESRIKVRIDRQEVLRREPPLHLDVVLAESALRLQVGGREVLRDQLRYLLAASEWPNVELQVLPDDTGAHPGTDGSFTIVEYPGPAQAQVVMVELMTGCMYLEMPAETAQYMQAFEVLQHHALSPSQSRARLRSIINAL